MRRSLLLTLFVLVPILAADEAPAKAGALSAKEASEGWLLLFDGETTFGWQVDGEVKVEKGVLVLGGTKETRAQTSLQLTSLALRLETDWSGDAPPKIWMAPVAHLEMQLLKESQGKFTPQSASATRLAPPGPALRFVVPAGTTLRLRNVRAQPLSMGPLLGGTDLAGWKIYKGDAKREKSKWTLTQGVLNLKNGPGDLQTEKTFADFVLQLECRSNGKHLNSGLFFRCVPGKYQEGYEAQIRNQFTAEPTQKYTLDEYDPKTHARLGKKTITATAVDYGTGAIYRRMPARKGIAKDGEWFTMTVVAHGRHLMTFVNGVQVVDWTDQRPANASARQGYRAEAGAISIQGHDPTTDLDFRNIRISPLQR